MYYLVPTVCRINSLHISPQLSPSPRCSHLVAFFQPPFEFPIFNSTWRVLKEMRFFLFLYYSLFLSYMHSQQVSSPSSLSPTLSSSQLIDSSSHPYILSLTLYINNHPYHQLSNSVIPILSSSSSFYAIYIWFIIAYRHRNFTFNLTYSMLNLLDVYTHSLTMLRINKRYFLLLSILYLSYIYIVNYYLFFFCSRNFWNVPWLLHSRPRHLH